MFDIGFPELLIVSVVALLVLGPERLPEALRRLGLWISRLRRSFMNVKAEIEREIGADDLRREIYNEEVLEKSSQFKSEIQSVVDDVNQPLVPGSTGTSHSTASARARTLSPNNPSRAASGPTNRIPESEQRDANDSFSARNP